MNTEEAKYIRYEVSHGDIRVEDFIAAEAKGFLECHELYKPLVEALEKMNRGHWGEAPELTNQALLYFRTKILGEL